jgi:ADP-heptose:LPS heptosyltransferase
MNSFVASPPVPADPPLRAGHYTAEVIAGPRGELAVFHFAFGNRSGRRLLVLKLDHYGDFLIGLPALKRLRQVFASDHITLVCGSWNAALAKRLGIADEVRAYDFFPENSADWTGDPFESLDRFREACRGSFDIALDLRVDEDTRFLLNHVEAATRCGIGTRARHPFLDIVLPPAFERRESEGRWMLIEPDRFESKMPIRTPFFHENDFSITNTHLVYGPYILLPGGRSRAHFGLRLLTAIPRLSRVRVVIDVARGAGSRIVSANRVSWLNNGEPREAVVEFTNDEPSAAYEFRIHARGRPLRSRLRFFGVRVELLDAPDARFKPAELHIGEQLSLLVDLIDQRTRKADTDDLFVRDPLPAGVAEISDVAASAGRVVISPVSNSLMRDWGIGNYARLTAILLERTSLQILLIGSGTQRAQLEQIVEQNGRDPRITNLAGRVDWSDTTTIVGAANLVIANNSGIAHLAAACEIPTIAIYSGSHQPQEWGPRGNDVHAVMALVPCSPCGYDKLEECTNDHLCMKQIAPETIADQAIALLTRPRGSWSPGDCEAGQI